MIKARYLILIIFLILPEVILAEYDVNASQFEITNVKYGTGLELNPEEIDLRDLSTIESQLSDVPNLDYALQQDVWEHWLLVDCRNSSTSEQEFVFDFENWVRVTLNDLSPSAQKKVYKTGHFIPYIERDFPSANKSLVSIVFQPKESKQLLIHLESTIDYLQIPQTIRFNVFDHKTYLQKRLSRRLLVGMFCGFYLIMLLYNLFIYSSTKDRNYLPYLISLVAVLILTIHNFGYFVSIFKGWSDYVYLHSKMQFIGSMLLGLSMLLFTAWFLDVKNRYPRLFTILKALMVVILMLPIPSLLGYASINEKISGLVGIITMIFILTVGIKSNLDKYPSSGYFLIGYGAFSLGIIVMLCTFLGILPTTLQEIYPVNIGSSIEMVFFSLALGNRINILKKDNEEKQTQIIDQLREKEELQLKLNKDLEEKVVLRTKEIQKQKEEIEEQKIEIEKEKDKADELLLNILPAPVAKELQLRGAATPRYYEQATVLFADIVSFTKKSSGLRPERIISELDYCFRGFDEILEKYGVEKIKTIGDGYMCVGGIPIPSEESAINTVRAAVDMQHFMDQWAEQKKEWNEIPWQIRIGIHTGEVVAGIVGKNKFAYDVWGLTVNTASRIEGVCEPGKVNISEDTYMLIKDQFETEFRGKVQTREKELDMYYVLRPK